MNKHIAIVLCVVVLSGCGYYNTFYNARRAYEKKQYDVAQKKCQSILSKKSQQWLHDDALYLQGLISFETQQYIEALYYFEKIHNEYPQSSAAPEARKKIIEIYFLQKEYNQVYTYVKAQIDSDPSRENIEMYANVLFSLRLEKEMAEFVAKYSQEEMPGTRYWAYYYHIAGKNDMLRKLLDSIKDLAMQKEIAEEIYFKSFDKDIWLSYLKNSPDYQYVEILYYKNITIADVDAFLELSGGIGLNQKITILEKLLFICIESEQFSTSKYIIMKLKTMQNSQMLSGKKQILEAKYSFSQDQLFDQPADWQHVFTNGNELFLLTDKYELYKVVNRKWERFATLNTPPVLSKTTLVFWDAIHQRWIFFDSERQDMTLHVLNFKDLQWDIVRLDNNLIPQFSRSSYFVYNNTIYIYYSINKVMKLLIEKDRVIADYIDIGGYIPALSAYTTFYLPSRGLVVLIGGKLNETADNPLAYVLNIAAPIPQWNEAFPTMMVDWNLYTVKQLLSPTGTFVTLWKTDIQTESGNKELYKTLSLDYVDNVVRIDENTKPIKMPIETLDYELLHYPLVPLLYFYKDTKTTFSNIKIIRMNLSLNYSTHEYNADSRQPQSSSYASKTDYDKLLLHIDRLNALSNDNKKDYHLMGDIYLYDMHLPNASIKMYEKAYEQSKNPVVLYGLGYIYYYYLKDMVKAELYFRKYLQSDSEDFAMRQRAEEFLKLIKKY